MSDAEQAQNQGQEATESPLLGAFSMPEGFYADTSSNTTDDESQGAENSAGDEQNAVENQESEGSEGAEGRDSEQTEQNASESGQGERLAPESGAETESDGEEETISSFQELAEHYELDWDWLKTLKVPVNVAGQTTETTFSDLVKSYKNTEAAESLLKEAKSKAGALNQELADKSKALESQFNTAATLIQRAEKLLDEDVGHIDWKTLREEDPAEYAAKKAEIQERRERLDKMKREAFEAYQTVANERQQAFQKHREERLAAEQKALLEKLPEWRDPEKMQTGQAKLQRYLLAQGFSEQDLRWASDHRLIVLARKAMLHDETEGRVDAAKKKVAMIPKTLKPGSKSSERPKPKSRDAAEILYGNP